MVLRCPRCSELKFFGRNQVLGELVVCPKCNAVFAWSEAGGTRAEPNGASTVAKDHGRSVPKRGKR